MTPQLKRLRALAERATPGPWEWDGEELIQPSKYPGLHNSVLKLSGWDTSNQEDRDFVAAANPHNVLKLIDAIEVLREGASRMARIQADKLLEGLVAALEKENG